MFDYKLFILDLMLEAIKICKHLLLHLLVNI